MVTSSTLRSLGRPRVVGSNCHKQLRKCGSLHGTEGFVHDTFRWTRAVLPTIPCNDKSHISRTPTPLKDCGHLSCSLLLSLGYHSCTLLLTPHASQDWQTAQTKGLEADRQPTGQRRGQEGPRVQFAVRGRGVLAREGRAQRSILR